MNIPPFIKQHPVAIGAGVIGIIVIFMVLRGSGGAAADTTGTQTATDPSAVAAGTALAQAQIGAQAQAAYGQTQLQGLQIQADRDVDLAGITSNTSEYIANLQSHSADLASTLNTQVAMGQLKNQSDATSIAFATQQYQNYTSMWQTAAYLQTIQALATGKNTVQAALPPGG